MKEVATNPGWVIAVGRHKNLGRLMNMHTTVHCASLSLKDFPLEQKEWQELARAVRRELAGNWRQLVKRPGVVKTLADKPEVVSLIPGTPMMEGQNGLPQVVL